MSIGPNQNENLPSNILINLEIFEKLMTKAEKYMTGSSDVKAMRCNNDRLCPLFYDIKDGEPITMQHILSILLYTDIF